MCFGYVICRLIFEVGPVQLDPYEIGLCAAGDGNRAVDIFSALWIQHVNFIALKAKAVCNI